MKRMGLVVVLVSVAFTGCLTLWELSNDSAQDDHRYTRENVHIPTEFVAGVQSFAEYQSYEYLAERERQRAESELRAPDLAGLPENGFIITIQRSDSIDSAAGDFSTAIVLDANRNVIMRHDIDAGVPDVDDGGFRGVDVFALPDGPIAFPIIVRITYSVGDNYYEWKFTPKGE